MTAVTRYLLDTNIWIYVMRNKPPQVRQRFAELTPASVVLSPVVLGELHVGWRKSERTEANRAALERYTRGALFEPLDANAASVYGDIRAEFEARGQPIGGNDLLIAAQALATDCVLVTDDEAEFTRISDLRIENWTR